MVPTQRPCRARLLHLPRALLPFGVERGKASQMHRSFCSDANVVRGGVNVGEGLAQLRVLPPESQW